MAASKGHTPGGPPIGKAINVAHAGTEAQLRRAAGPPSGKAINVADASVAVAGCWGALWSGHPGRNAGFHPALAGSR